MCELNYFIQNRIKMATSPPPPPPPPTPEAVWKLTGFRKNPKLDHTNPMIGISENCEIGYLS